MRPLFSIIKSQVPEDLRSSYIMVKTMQIVQIARRSAQSGPPNQVPDDGPPKPINSGKNCADRAEVRAKLISEPSLAQVHCLNPKAWPANKSWYAMLG